MVLNPTRGRKLNPRMAVEEAGATPRHEGIVGNVQMGRRGLGLGSGKPVWKKEGPNDKKKLIVEQIHKQPGNIMVVRRQGCGRLEGATD